MTPKRELAAAVGLVAVAACFMTGVLWAFTREPEPWCFTYELGLFFAGAFVCLVAAFIGAVMLAVLRASVSTYLVVVVALAIMAALGYVAGMLGSDCAPLDGALVVLSVALLVFALAFGAAGIGATLGSLVGDLLGRFGVRVGPDRPDAHDSATRDGHAKGPREDGGSRDEDA